MSLDERYNRPETSNGHAPQAGYRKDRTIMRPSNIPRDTWIRIMLGPEHPTEEDGNYGRQYSYYLDFPTDAILYANEKLHAAICHVSQTGVQNLAICKTKSGRADVWTVEPWREPTAARAPQTTRRLNAAPQTQPQPAATIAQYPDAGEMQEAVNAQVQASQRTAQDVALYRAWITAIDLIATAAKYARDKHGLLIQPLAADIRATAATLYIQAGKS